MRKNSEHYEIMSPFAAISAPLTAKALVTIKHAVPKIEIETITGKNRGGSLQTNPTGGKEAVSEMY